MSDLYRLVYASKNLLQGSDAEIAAAVSQILDASRRNNAGVAVTGALMFNAGAFAQVLEGPREGVENTFERIQCDPRHGDVTVLQCGLVESRTFTNWSMAFVGQSEAGRTRWDGIAAASGFDLTRLDGDAVFAMLHGLVLEEEGLPAAASPPAEPSRQEGGPGPGLDVERVRAELPQAFRAPQAVRDAGAMPASGQAAGSVTARPEAALAVLRAALAQERQITTDLRNELDTVRIALAIEQELAATLRGERDLWAGRAQVLASAMSREASAVAEDAPAAAGRAEVAVRAIA
ncbi:hypothetical protein BHAOGJBA_2394 [Methylobacterium hispanicum]|uniref:BLUF domain-containing protein n=1 Tax=Methylobacterium hispanicum TaxID=270350 RepID=A0AAV4ZM11_9HYPH|nr:MULTISPECIES: BLUF domain-containing protein [Methylobacterium]GJD88871.1 hypothetical protein BHAOGJBA_2394 [Methylobacterium hispanicum]